MKLLKIILIFLFTLSLQAQQSKLSKAVNHISEYIASEQFVELKNKIGDIAATDSIYTAAITFTGKDYPEALLSLMLATVPYREVPIQIPLINLVINYPLTSADEETFLEKNKNLPSSLFLDTPKNNYGDKDKLAHFFGSAFLSYESRFFDLGMLIGYFVEAFEESFKVQSSIDLRDLDVNEYGRLFGKILKEDKTILPSQIILLRSLRYIRIIL
ncbi:MAG TPA: hypothetical protein VK870_15075 [Ignavibacteriaceae bacterium]|nr:hypothetical protein [Ignavibacteriaceae bacterium]